jgi:hypothetical protein
MKVMKVMKGTNRRTQTILKVIRRIVVIQTPILLNTHLSKKMKMNMKLNLILLMVMLIVTIDLLHYFKL